MGKCSKCKHYKEEGTLQKCLSTKAIKEIKKSVKFICVNRFFGECEFFEGKA